MTPAAKRTANAVLPAKPSKRTKAATAMGFSIPPPADGVEYTRVEVIQIVTMVPKVERDRRSKLINFIQPRVPVKREAITDLVRKHEVFKFPLSELDKPWKSFGRNSIVSPEQLRELDDKIAESRGGSLTRGAVAGAGGAVGGLAGGIAGLGVASAPVGIRWAIASTQCRPNQIQDS